MAHDHSHGHLFGPNSERRLWAPLLSAHLQAEVLAEWDATLGQLCEALQAAHHLEHVTLQPETGDRCHTLRGPLNCTG